MRTLCIFVSVVASMSCSYVLAEPPDRAIGVRPATSASAAGRRWLFMVGVNEYLKQPKLKYCRQDCKALRDELVRRGEFKPENVVMLTDDAARELDRPTFAQIYDRLPQMLESAGPDDLILVYLSGHGAQFEDAKGKYPCFVPLDGGSRQTCIALSWVSEQMEACSARSKILVLDCCRNDVAQGGKSTNSLQDSLLNASQGKGFVTLFSCDAGQRSAEHDKAPNGVYTHYLIEGLAGKADRNGDKKVDVAEAHDYAHDRTQTWGIQHAQPQEPILRGEFATKAIITFVDPNQPNRPLSPVNVRPNQPESPVAASDLLTLDLGKGQKIELVRVPPGEFMMGTADSDQNSGANEKPQRKVKIEKAFFMGKFEVTQEQWKAVMGTEPFAFREELRLPAEQVSWNDCQSFCEKASRLLKREVRLPTEAEWEYASRAGTTKQYGFGNAGDVPGGLGRYAWYIGNSDGKTHPVGSRKPNAWGLHDMHGNVWEWCEDVYHETYEGAPSDARSWSGEFNGRVLRGGSWYMDALGCRSAFRQFGDPGGQVNDVGFRIVVNE